MKQNEKNPKTQNPKQNKNFDPKKPKTKPKKFRNIIKIYETV